MKRFACNFFSVFFALLLCVGLIPAVAFAQPDEEAEFASCASRSI